MKGARVGNNLKFAPMGRPPPQGVPQTGDNGFLARARIE